MKLKQTLLCSILSVIALVAPEWRHAQALGDNPEARLSWSYSKSSIIDFLAGWRDQIRIDPDLEIREKDLRIDLMDRFLFQFDRKYSEQNLRSFLIEITWDMALTDEMAQNRPYLSQAEFLKNLSLALREVLEPSENILGFLRSYVEFVSAKKPKTLDEFALSRSYTNGEESIQAHGVSLTEAGGAVPEEEFTLEDSSPSEDLQTREVQTPTVPDQILTPSLPQTAGEDPTL